jgi:hypothetical protein
MILPDRAGITGYRIIPLLSIIAGPGKMYPMPFYGPSDTIFHCASEAEGITMKGIQTEIV